MKQIDILIRRIKPLEDAGPFVYDVSVDIPQEDGEIKTFKVADIGFFGNENQAASHAGTYGRSILFRELEKTGDTYSEGEVNARCV